MVLFINYLFKSLFLPPGLILVLFLTGFLLMRFRPMLARVVLSFSMIMGYMLCTPWFSQIMINPMQTIPALTKEQIRKSGAGAIVVLSGGRYANSPEYGGDTVDDDTLIRLRYGAYLHNILGLPVLVTGGHGIDPRGDSFAKLMADTLKQDYRIQNVWQEDRSRTTAENALFAKKILTEKGIKRILLVTHAWHMPRSVAIFKHAGVEVIPAPTMFLLNPDIDALDFLPNSDALKISYIALHEMVGRGWYAIRY